MPFFPFPPSQPRPLLLQSLCYPNTLKPSRQLFNENCFLQTLHDPNSDLCFSLDDYCDFGPNFFYRNCPGVVTSADRDSLSRTFTLPDCDFLRWLIVNSPRYDVVIDVPMRDHIVLLFQLCLKAIMREATGLVDSILNKDGRELNPTAMSLYHGWLLFHDINFVSNDFHVLYNDGDVDVLRLDKECWELADNGHKPTKVGVKSRNIGYLKGKVPSWVGIPTSVALPFGVFEKVLSESLNQELSTNQ
ncbi:hypothetical protein LOK49_LG09G00490 [Camellia lanceoleosa]|uniref:Uncharacterized protein n=1 Tax=Camellia lanceoleosa TaxID=1840588 RepID=A0ACC0GIV7_9ERIC|nr:hypothetical protein LOK49_LG09G00490 [Camellia lanceoleosa]